MSYVYIQTEHSADHDLYTVGFYDPTGKFQSDSDHSSRDEAADRVHYLNGGSAAPARAQMHPSLHRKEVPGGSR